MTISSHPEEATLIAYAAGALSEPFAIVVSAHAEMCETCRRRLAALNALGAAVVASEPFEAVDAEAFDRLVGLLETDDRRSAARRRPPEPPSTKVDLPGPLARVVGGGEETIQWRTIVPGAEDRRYAFETRFGAQTLRFLRGAPGQEIPEHAHAGSELTLVLRGALRDGDRIFRAGDVTDLGAQTQHNPVVDGEETCVCVIAEEGPPKFVSPTMQELQRRIGI